MKRFLIWLRLLTVTAVVPLMAASTNSSAYAKIERAAEELPASVQTLPEETAPLAEADTQSKDAADQRIDVFPQRTPHDGIDGNLFDSHSWYTPPPPPPVRTAPKPVPRKPVAPPLPFKLLGIYEQEGRPTMYFLVKGDRTYDVEVGDTLDNTYTVDSVTNGQLMFTYLPLKTSQGLRLGDAR